MVSAELWDPKNIRQSFKSANEKKKRSLSMSELNYPIYLRRAGG